MSLLALEIVLGFMQLDVVSVWERLIGVDSHLSSMDSALIYGKECKIDRVPHELSKIGKPHFCIDIMDVELQYGHIANHDLSRVAIKKCITQPDGAIHWVEPFFSLPFFRSARLYDIEYEFWQNAEDPLQYNAKKRSYDHLPMRSNGLPFPLEQQVIDTSQNPGRRVLRDGYVEAVGSHMWLGKEFWELTGANKDNVRLVDEICTQDDDVFFLQANPSPFVSSENEEGIKQDVLRNVLFPNARTM